MIPSRKTWLYAVLTGWALGGVVLSSVHFGSGCAEARLSPEEAEKELDVACGVLSRSIVTSLEQDRPHPELELLLTRICNARGTRSAMERALVGTASEPHSEIIETFSYSPDAGE